MAETLHLKPRDDAPDSQGDEDRPARTGIRPVQDERTLARLRSFYDAGACLLDEMELESWPNLFTQDARYRIIARENYDQGLTHATIYCNGRGMISDRVVAIREALIFEVRHLRHMVSGVRINGQDHAVLRAQANFLIVESIADALPEIVMAGRYMDELVDDGERFLIRSRDCVFDNYWTPRSVVIPI